MTKDSTQRLASPDYEGPRNVEYWSCRGIGRGCVSEDAPIDACIGTSIAVIMRGILSRLSAADGKMSAA